MTRIIVILIGLAISSYGSYFNFEAGNDEGGWILFAVAVCFLTYGGFYCWNSKREITFLKNLDSNISKYMKEISLLLCGLSILVLGWETFLETMTTYIGLKFLAAIVVFCAPLGIAWLVKKMIFR